jgi:sugar/nucleoside kinase (ribokinase family)
MSLIVTGTIGIDTVETPTGRAENVLGGSCAYFAAAASFHTPVRVVAAVGGDWPKEHRAILQGFKNIDLSGLETRQNSKTFAWGGRYHDNMDHRDTLYTHLGVVEEKPPHVPANFRDSQFVFLANTHPAVQMELLSHFPDRKLAVADTMDLWINIAKDELLELLRNINGLALNYDEAEQLTDQRNPITAARKILEWGPQFVTVKKGEHGSILVHHDGVAVLPAYPSEIEHVVDPTGAGDSFAGGMMGHIAANGRADFPSIQSAMAWGTVTASFTIETFGLDRLRQIKRSDIDARMEKFRCIARVG